MGGFRRESELEHETKRGKNKRSGSPWFLKVHVFVSVRDIRRGALPHEPPITIATRHTHPRSTTPHQASALTRAFWSTGEARDMART